MRVLAFEAAETLAQLLELGGLKATDVVSERGFESCGLVRNRGGSRRAGCVAIGVNLGVVSA